MENWKASNSGTEHARPPKLYMFPKYVRYWLVIKSCVTYPTGGLEGPLELRVLYKNMRKPFLKSLPVMEKSSIFENVKYSCP